MLIDWFTVAAQAFNFLILLWLLKRFLYKPILQAIDTREQRIALTLTEADAKKAEAQKKCDMLRHKNKLFDQERVTLMNQVVSEVEIERQHLIKKAQQEADTLTLKRQKSLRSDAQNLSKTIRQHTQQEVFAIARQVLKDLASIDLEARLVAVFIRRLQKLDEPTKAGLIKAIKTTAPCALVRSAFNLSEKQRKLIQVVCDDTFSVEIQLQFEIAPDVISGIELTITGWKIGWSIADYLSSLEKSMV